MTPVVERMRLQVFICCPNFLEQKCGRTKGICISSRSLHQSVALKSSVSPCNETWDETYPERCCLSLCTMQHMPPNILAVPKFAVLEILFSVKATLITRTPHLRHV